MYFLYKFVTFIIQILSAWLKLKLSLTKKESIVIYRSILSKQRRHKPCVKCPVSFQLYFVFIKGI